MHFDCSLLLLIRQDSVIMADTTFIGLLESLLPRCPSVQHVILLTGGRRDSVCVQLMHTGFTGGPCPRS